MRRSLERIALALGGVLAASAVTFADTAADAYRAMGISTGDVLAGTVLNGRVLPEDEKLVVSVTTYFTGAHDDKRAVSVRLDVFRRREKTLVSIYSRDFGAEQSGLVGRGDLQLVDLDGDAVNEIIVSFDNHADPLIDERLSEVLRYGGNGFETAWAGSIEYDATKAARRVPVERRDRYKREIDWPATLKSRGQTLVFKKVVLAVAGESLPEPKPVSESFPLRTVPPGS
jgi:hypothetical protein